MIKQLVNLVMPKSLGVIGTATLVAGGISAVSSVLGGFGAKKRNKDVREAQARQREVEKAVRAEQAVRSRRNQFKQARAQTSAIEATNLAGGGTGASSGAVNATAGVQANLATNLGNINTSLASSSALSRAGSDVLNANVPSNAELFNSSIVQPIASTAFNFFGTKDAAKT